MAGDKAVALNLLTDVERIEAILEERFGLHGLSLRKDGIGTTDSVTPTESIVNTLKAKLVKLRTRVTAMQDSA